MSRRSLIATRNLRSRNIKPTISGLLESDGQIQAQTQAQAMSVPTIPTILRRRKRCTEVGHYETTPVSSKESRPYIRKRKCILPKSDATSCEDDDIEIITLAASDGLSSESHEMTRHCSSSPSSMIASNGKMTRSKSAKATLNRQFQTMSIDLAANELTPSSSICHQYSASHYFSPLPNFSWADAKEVWDLMLHKDETYKRNPDFLKFHPTLQARMRSILLDWLSEVCEVYRLHRDTYYLAVDFIDRYLSSEGQIPKQHLQLIGITCLFIAAKIEEIYPPKLSEFAYVTDGACTDDELISKELVILKRLKWNLCPMTVNSWLTVFMQLYSTQEKENAMHRRNSKEDDSFMIPDYPSSLYAQIAHLLDLCILDLGSLNYSNSVIAASALYHFTNENTVYKCTGLHLDDIRDCVVWMVPFALAIRDEGFDNPKIIQKFKESEECETSSPIIQSHTVDIALLEKAHVKQSQPSTYEDDSTSSSSQLSSPIATYKSSQLLTPPKSSSKSK